MKIYVFNIYTEYLSDLQEGVQANDIFEAYRLVCKLYPNAISINYDSQF